MIRELYPESRWHWQRFTGRTAANKAKTEVLLVNRSGGNQSGLFVGERRCDSGANRVHATLAENVSDSSTRRDIQCGRWRVRWALAALHERLRRPVSRPASRRVTGRFVRAPRGRPETGSAVRKPRDRPGPGASQTFAWLAHGGRQWIGSLAGREQVRCRGAEARRQPCHQIDPGGGGRHSPGVRHRSRSRRRCAQVPPGSYPGSAGSRVTAGRTGGQPRR